MNEIVFVYGTLKSGQRAGWMMSRNGEKIADGTVSGKLIDLGAFPGLIRCDGQQAHGEVWSVEQGVLSLLDSYEGEGVLYDRVKVDVTCEGQVIQDVWAYEYRTDSSWEHKEIEGGFWPEKKLSTTLL